MKQLETDVLIIGGGLVGASLACVLPSLGLRTTLVEAVPPRAPSSPSYDDRTLALGRASCLILEGLGLWDALEPNATPIRQVVVSELGAPGRVRLDSAEMGLERFGAVVEARAFGVAVMDRVGSLEGVDFLCPARATALQTGAPATADRDESGSVTPPDAVHVSVEGESGPMQLKARLVVGADGADSMVRELLGIPAEVHDYAQAAVICNVTPTEPHRCRAFERMTPTGPFALLPHAGERCGLVWCVPDAEAADLLALPEETFLARATERSGGALGTLRRLGRRSAYPLKQVRASRDTLGRVLLLGNAAHAIHPVGAQGFNLGLRDVAVLAELLAAHVADARDAGEVPDPGAPALLEAYAAWRRPDREATIGWTHDMVSVFGSESVLARGARSLGLAAVGLLPPLRRRLASRAMGYRGKVPRLALGEPLLAPGEAAS